METNNPLMCDPDSGFCVNPNVASEDFSVGMVAIKKPVKLVYFTDPICSSCWGIEPQLRRLKLEYGDYIEVEYHMGGLLPDWSYNSGGISKPSDVAHHWDEVSAYYQMPIDGDVWLEDPLASSYPPSIAFKAAQMQDEKKALVFLRETREMVFLQKKNITKWEHLEKAAQTAGLDIPKFKSHYEGEASTHFKKDLELARQMNVRGFPTIFFSDSTGKTETIYGVKLYAAFEAAVISKFAAAKKYDYKKDWESLFNYYQSLTLREFAELSQTDMNTANLLLDKLSAENKLVKTITKNGAIWKVKD